MIEKHNLLTGSVPRKLAVFALPLLLANMLQSFYNVVDMLVIGQIVGDVGLAAISNASKLDAQSPVFPRLKRSRCRSSQEVNDSPTPFSALNYC